MQLQFPVQTQAFSNNFISKEDKIVYSEWFEVNFFFLSLEVILFFMIFLLRELKWEELCLFVCKFVMGESV